MCVRERDRKRRDVMGRERGRGGMCVRESRDLRETGRRGIIWRER